MMAMKLGAEDKKKVVVAIALAAIVLALVLWNVFSLVGPGSTQAPPPQEVAQSPAPPALTSQTGQEHQAVRVSGSLLHLDPTLHPEWMAAAESLQYHGTGRNIFSMSSAPVQIEQPKGPLRPNPKQVVAQGPPPPPAIDLKFFGYESHNGGTRRAFLLHGDDIFIASTGDVVDHRYKIVSIAPMSIQVQDIPYNDTQTLPLIQN